jgi:hypothetical protein
METRPVTIVETREFQARAAALFSGEEIAELIELIAYHPTAGVVIPGTGGVRKLRWGVRGRGRRGGARVVYFFHNESLPVFLFTAYAKSAKDDLTPAEQRALRRLAHELIDE